MEIYANGQLLPFEVTEEKTLKELLQSILRLTGRVDKMVLKCVVNGEEIDLNAREQHDGVKAEDVLNIEIDVVNRGERIVSSLDDAVQILPNIAKICDSIVTYLSQGNKKLAMESLSMAMDNWQKIVQFTQLVQRTYELNLDTEEIEGRSFESINLRVVDVLELVKKAIVSDDAVAFSDAVEYEVKAQLADQEKMLLRLQELVKEKAKELLSSLDSAEG